MSRSMSGWRPTRAACTTFPYAFRVAVPWLVYVLPFSHVVSFTLLAWLAIAASAAVLYELLGGV